MSSKKAIIAFADTILQHFPPFRWDDGKEAAWADTMVRELATFSDEVIDAASREMVRTRRKEKTPLVAECIEACVEARRWMEAKREREKLPMSGGTFGPLDHTAERLKLAKDLACNPRDPLCVQAAKDGWIGILHGFVRKHGRMPDKSRRIEYRKDYRPEVNSPGVVVDEVEWCKREARDFDEAYAKCVRGGWNQAAGHEKTGATMLRKRKEMAALVLGGRA